MRDLLPGYIPPGEVPNGWEKLQLRDVALIVPGGTLGVTTDNYIASGVPAFSAAGQDGYVDIAEFHSPGVVLSSIGAHCGRCFRAEDAWTTLANTQAILPNLERVDHRFLFARLNDKTYWEKLGSAQPFIKPSSVKESWIALPPIEEQRRIAEVLDSIDGTIQATELVIAKHESLRVGIASDLLGGRMRVSSASSEKLDQKLNQLISSNSTTAEWRECRLGEIGKLKMGQSPAGSLVTPFSGGLPFLQGNAEFGAYFPTAVFQCDKAPRRSALGDSLISVRAPVGAINFSDLEYGIGRGLAAITFETVEPSFGHYLLQNTLRNLHRVAQGTTFSAIGLTELAELRLSVPPLAEQKRIAEVLDSVDETIQAAKRERDKLVQLRAGLAADLLSGRVRTVVG